MTPRERLDMLRKMEGMTPREKLNALRALETQPAVVAERETAATPEASTADKVIGSVPGRTVLGAAETVVGGPFQFGANVGSWLNRNVAAPIYDALGMEDSARYARDPRYDVGRMANETQSEIEASKRRGMAAHGAEGTDIAGTIGGLAAGVGALRNVAVPGTLLGKVWQGAKIGGGFGAAAPVMDGDYGSEKTSQIASGAALGGLMPIGIAAGGAAYKKAKDVGALLFPSPDRVGNLSAGYLRKITGEQNVDPVVDALRKFRPDVAGQAPTASQALRNVPAGSPIVAQSRITASQPGGASASFGRRWQDQQTAIDAAKGVRDRITASMREKALDAATNIDKGALQDRFAAIAAHPEINTNSAVQNVLTAARNELANAETSRNIYGLRRTLDDMISGRIESAKNIPKQTVPRLIEMKDAIDDAIEGGGAGPVWRDYLHVFSNRTRHIKNAEDALATPFASPQRTNVQGGQNIAAEQLPALPNPLIREVMVLNKLASMMKNRAEPAIDKAMTAQLSSPKALANALERAGADARAKQEIIEQLYGLGRIPSLLASQE